MDLNINNPEQIKLMIAMLQKLLPENKDIEAEQTEELNDKIKTKTRKRNKPTKNKFDSMPEKRMHQEDIAIDKKLAIQPPTQRSRPFQAINVTCRSCGKKESVNPSLLPDSADRYKCNKCSSTAG